MTPPVTPLLPIGTFAARCRLSVKALRHYDEQGLLRPARVDVATGYRWYRAEQAPAAIAIALLRSLDVPLPAIRELLARGDDAALADVLARERDRRTREIARAETALRAIERLIRAGTVFPYDVALRDDPEQTIVWVEGATTADLHVETGTALVARLLGRLARAGLTPAGPITCLVRPEAGDTLRLRMCAPVTDPPPANDVDALPAGPVAVAHHVGPYEELGLADHAVHAWAEAHGLAPSGPLRERYLNDPARVSPDALETEVVLPVSRPAGRTPRAAAARR